MISLQQMLFSSNLFLLLFLPMVLLAYFFASKVLKFSTTFHNLLLISFSIFFYFWGSGKFIIVFFSSIIFNFLFEQLISRYPKLKKLFLILGVCCNLGILGYFKYFGFFYQQTSSILNLHLPPIGPIFLPIGISFYTFMAISYLVDVYRQQKPAKLTEFSLYLSFFPHLVAGPIVRYQEISDQIKNRHPNLDSFFNGLWRFSVGLAKKVIIANSAGQLADKVFSLPTNEFGSVLAVLGMIAYSIQIYFDFSGYSDMAIGLASLFGFNFPENFNHPYTSISITDFWRRWHISLSRFFRDYLYIPLGGSRKGTIRTYINLVIVFTLCGLWHGASWTFIVWGLYHGFLLVIERILKKIFNFEPKNAIYKISTFVLVTFGWVIFRSPNLDYAIGYVKTVFSFSNKLPPFYTLSYYVPANIAFYLVLGLVLSFIPLSRPKNNIICGVIILVLTVISLSFLSKSTFTPFIYFQF